jgi:hypothetical protein
VIWIGLLLIVLGFILMPGGPAGAQALTSWTPFVVIMVLAITMTILLRLV